ncbi:MAG: FRG domain-containing protein [Verrucomicrobiota bacterium]
MPQVFKVQSVEEAVELAASFKKEGRYNWFRGQTRDWPPLSSAARLIDNPELFEKAEQRQLTFLLWVKKTPGLEKIGDDIDATLAIAQHYGIPTTLLDFTIEPGVAGFFAALKSKDADGFPGCIYCLNTNHLREFWTLMRKVSGPIRDVPDVDFITTNVPNLWRLEAQHGVFLYAPANWHEIYPLDKIVFPQTGYPSYPTKGDIYPNQKSQLELHLDHFFTADDISNFYEMVMSMFPDAKCIELETPRNGFEEKFFVRGNIPVMPCWHLRKVQDWQVVFKEPLRETALGEIGLGIDLRAEAQTLRRSVAYGVLRALDIDPTLRKKAVRWIILPQKRLQEKLSRSLDWLWNGCGHCPTATRTSRKLLDYALRCIG